MPEETNEGAPRRTVFSDKTKRKYLLNGCPDLVLQTQPILINQGWMLGFRLQSIDDLVRGEFRYSISWILLYLLWPLTRGKRVRKLRYAVETLTAGGPHTWEIDVFLDRTLCLAAIEVPAADEVALPAWLLTQVVCEVTGDTAYADAYLAK